MSRGKQKPDEQCRLSWLNIRLTAEERAKLDELAKQQVTTVTDLARQGLSMVLEQRSSATPGTPA